MSQELIYTSARKGLKIGSHGFCTVASTEGMAPNLADRLEKLTGYRHIHSANDKQNPVNWTYVTSSIAGQTFHILGRIGDAGLDYTQRTNKIAHLWAMARKELLGTGSAWLMSQQGLLQTEWTGEPRYLPARNIPRTEITPEVCNAWKNVLGDAGWAGVLAETIVSEKPRDAYLIYQPPMDLLPLMLEAQSLLSPEHRLDATFSTYFTQALTGTRCRWRCVVKGTPEAARVRKSPRTLILDLTTAPTENPTGKLVELARTGKDTRLPVTKSKDTRLPVTKKTAPGQTIPEQEFFGPPKVSRPPLKPNKTVAGPPPTSQLPATTPPLSTPPTPQPTLAPSSPKDAVRLWAAFAGGGVVVCALFALIVCLVLFSRPKSGPQAKLPPPKEGTTSKNGPDRPVDDSGDKQPTTFPERSVPSGNASDNSNVQSTVGPGTEQPGVTNSTSGEENPGTAPNRELQPIPGSTDNNQTEVVNQANAGQEENQNGESTETDSSTDKSPLPGAEQMAQPRTENSPTSPQYVKLPSTSATDGNKPVLLFEMGDSSVNTLTLSSSQGLDTPTLRIEELRGENYSFPRKVFYSDPRNLNKTKQSVALITKKGSTLRLKWDPTVIRKPSASSSAVSLLKYSYLMVNGKTKIFFQEPYKVKLPSFTRDLAFTKEQKLESPLPRSQFLTLELSGDATIIFQEKEENTIELPINNNPGCGLKLTVKVTIADDRQSITIDGITTNADDGKRFSHEKFTTEVKHRRTRVINTANALIRHSNPGKIRESYMKAKENLKQQIELLKDVPESDWENDLRNVRKHLDKVDNLTEALARDSSSTSVDYDEKRKTLKNHEDKFPNLLKLLKRYSKIRDRGAPGFIVKRYRDPNETETTFFIICPTEETD